MADDRSFDELYDDAAFRTSRTTFHGQPRLQQPGTATAYRRAALMSTATGPEDYYLVPHQLRVPTEWDGRRARSGNMHTRGGLDAN